MFFSGFCATSFPTLVTHLMQLLVMQQRGGAGHANLLGVCSLTLVPGVPMECSKNITGMMKNNIYICICIWLHMMYIMWAILLVECCFIEISPRNTQKDWDPTPELGVLINNTEGIYSIPLVFFPFCGPKCVIPSLTFYHYGSWKKFDMNGAGICGNLLLEL